ncbi:Catalyzes the conversion of GlcNAc-6-P into GlcNAc-1-P [Teratosphaeria destructans]|uniref:Phosphoacetylglucosamine mutase n=1 Tax=Teratosphaeria destructans TaxID=418781 RepID=A0A9W7VYD9_9PEZI|nr:Catalyzes the conversion of GlcNAc-6-P into GlcNAc-1-P [Teratosphaeria destructans]
MAASIDQYAAALQKAAEKFPRADTDRDFTYGTAGFRMRADLLDYVVFTVGLTAALRSRKLNGKTIGVMITASHNPAEDNGVKIVDPMGEMMEQEWERPATVFSNIRDPHQLSAGFKEAVRELRVDISKPANVIFARDTRPSGARLVKALVAALEAAGAKYQDYGYNTTPQLHYLVRATNTQDTDRPFGEVSEEGYYKKLAAAYGKAMQYSTQHTPVTIDGANGVGAPKMKELLKYLPKNKFKCKIVNDKIENPDILNSKAGADFVKTSQRAPEGFDGKPYDRWASFDGDADRIVYYFHKEGSVFKLLDGDRIATLAAAFIGDLVRKAGLEESIKIAVVQTAYANGGSTKYVEQVLKLKVEFTPTGVKHLHHVAAQSDIGVYFEANGHGTVLFSDRALRVMRKHEPESPAQLEALDTLKALSELINQTVGDAISDLLLVEVILAHKDWTVVEWLNTYNDLPNKLAKVVVKDRSQYKTVPNTAERKLQTPEGMQKGIDNIVAKYKQGRSFVRASGTEDAVRVYAEAAESYEVEDMIGKVCDLIRSTDSDSTPSSTNTTADSKSEHSATLGRSPQGPNAP